MARHFRAYEPRHLLFSNGQQTLGVALPWAMAACMVCPGKQVVSVSGDGGFLFSGTTPTTRSASRRSSGTGGRPTPRRRPRVTAPIRPRTPTSASRGGVALRELGDESRSYRGRRDAPVLPKFQRSDK
ncbi:thiamine pyrophosphate-dependent enzyme [Streptomyces sp. NPDC004069]